MTPKWNRIVVQEDVGVLEIMETPAGKRLMPGLNVAACDEDVEQVRTGYRCIHCWEPLETAWPKVCPLCKYPIRSHQSEQFAQVYKGHDPTARTGADWDLLADQLEERQERRAFLRRAKESGISLASRKLGDALRRAGIA